MWVHVGYLVSTVDLRVRAVNYIISYCPCVSPFSPEVFCLGVDALVR